VIAGRADEISRAQERDQSQARCERQDQAKRCDQPHGSGRITLQQPAHLSARGEHEQKQAQLVDRAQGGGRHAGIGEDPVLDHRRDRGKGRRTEQDAAEDLADCGGLPEPGEQAARAVRGNEEDRERDKQSG